MASNSNGSMKLEANKDGHVNNKVSRKTTFSEKIKNHKYRNDLLHSIWIALSLFSVGITVGQMGPSFLDLQIITNTKVEKASAFFTGTSVGFLTGSVISGSIYSKVNKPFLQFFVLLVLGAATIATPYCKMYPLMIFIRFIVGICCGCIETAGNAEHMRIWGNEGQVLMQLLHFSFAFGGVISPLYSEPFLAEKNEDGELLPNRTNRLVNVTSPIENITMPNFSLDENLNINISHLANGTIHIENVTMVNSSLDEHLKMNLPQSTNVHWAFLITGVCVFLTAIPFIILFFQGIKMKKQQDASNSKTEQATQRKLPKAALVITLVTLCSFYMLYCCVEDSFASFLMTFLVKEYPYVTKSKGAHITAIYWASFAAGRFSMIFISKFLKALQLLCLCCLLMLIAYTSFFVSAAFAVNNPSALIAIIFFASMAGVSVSAIFPSGFSWTGAELLRVTGPVSSLILVSASMGTTINPLLLGFLLEEVSNMWFCYLLLMETILLCCVFVFLLAFNRLYLDKHYGPLVDQRVFSLSLEVSEQSQPLNTLTSTDEKFRL